MRTAGPQLRRSFDSSRAPGSDVAGRLPGISGDHDLAGPEDGAGQEMARSVAAGRHWQPPGSGSLTAGI
jgi:hypothetical protein